MRYRFILIFLFPVLGFAQSAGEFSFDSTVFSYASQIDTTRIKSHLNVLAGDSLEGRETGKKGQKMAADYISNYFLSLGLENAPGTDLKSDYTQKFSLFSYSYSNSVLHVGNDTLKPFDDYYSFDLLSDTVLNASGAVFLGYGIESENYNNYPKKDIAGKIGVIFEGEPMVKNKFVLTGTDQRSEWSKDFTKKRKAAVEHGLIALIIINPDYESGLARVRRYFRSNKMVEEPIPNAELPRFTMGRERWNTLFPKESMTLTEADLTDGKETFKIQAKRKFRISYGDNGTEIETENVYGVVRGSDFPDQYVFITAHYDHLGKHGGEIYNGADDDGSGTSAVLELARIFSQAKKENVGPKRSMVFMLMTGEEKGLLGSSYYSGHPIFPLDSTIADLNIDMIGRTDTDHLEDTVKYIYPIGSEMISKDLHAVLERSNSLYSHLKLDYRYDDPNDPERLYYRSDHYNFARHGVPVIFFFRGLHSDYHKPTDTIDKIEYDTMRSVGKLIFATAWEVANRKDGLRKNGTDFR